MKALRPRRLAEYISILLSCLFAAVLILVASPTDTPSPPTRLTGSGHIGEGGKTACVIGGKTKTKQENKALMRIKR